MSIITFIDTGTGLGFFIAKRIISQHKGRINIESKLNKGTKMIVQLPAFDK